MTEPIVNIRNALEGALGTIDPNLPIVFENINYEPQPGVPYCEAFLLVAAPSNPTMGDGYHQEQGVFQVTLKFPTDEGTLACATLAGQVKALFKRGATFSDGGVDVKIMRTPTILQGLQDNGRWRQDVRITFNADIFSQ